MSTPPVTTNTPLKQALADAERSYAWLGRKVGVSRSTAMRWADGWYEPDEDAKAKISAALKRDVNDLFPAGANGDDLKAAA